MGDAVTIGVDLGYGRIKIAGPGFRSSFPAVVAEPLTGSEFAGLVEWEGRRFLVGEPALVEPHHRYSAQDDKVVTPEEMAKFLLALANAAEHYDHGVFSVATGLPPAGYRNAALKQQLVNTLPGNFRFAVEGRVYTISVPEVTVQPQAGEALFEALLHDDGEIADLAFLELRTIVVDVGHRTTDVALMSGHEAAMGSRWSCSEPPSPCHPESSPY